MSELFNNGTPDASGTGLGETNSGGVNPGQHPNNGVQLPQAAPQPQPQQAQPVAGGDFGFDPNDETFQAFNQQLQTYVGVDAYALRNYVQHIENQVREQALTPLRNEWGEAFEDNFTRVREKFNSLPDHQKAIYDNVDGARFLWQQVQNELAQEQQAAQVPTFDRGKAVNTAVTPTGRYKYTQSQILNLSPKEYKQHAAEIADAYSRGLVDPNS